MLLNICQLILFLFMILFHIMSFSKNLKTELFYSGIQQKKLSEQTGIPYPTVTDYINGRSLPNIVNGVKIARALNVSVEYLVTEREIDNNVKQATTILKDLNTLPPVLVRPLKEFIHCLALLMKRNEV